jgi:hypothetical protein
MEWYDVFTVVLETMSSRNGFCDLDRSQRFDGVDVDLATLSSARFLPRLIAISHTADIFIAVNRSINGLRRLSS